MLGELMSGLTNPATAREVVGAVAAPAILARIRAEAENDDAPEGALVASRVRHLVDHGGEDVWLDLLGAMSGSAQPGAAAIERILARTFPDPVRVRVARTGP
jgi:hypothetical protein